MARVSIFLTAETHRQARIAAINSPDQFFKAWLTRIVRERPAKLTLKAPPLERGRTHSDPKVSIELSDEELAQASADAKALGLSFTRYVEALVLRKLGKRTAAA